MALGTGPTLAAPHDDTRLYIAIRVARLCIILTIREWHSGLIPAGTADWS